jgi:toxin ParE2
MIVELSELAQEELEHGRAHYEAEREGLGDVFLDELEELITTVGERPYSFAKLQRSRAYRGLATRFPYQVIFFILADKVRVICVAHQHQKPGYWRGRR